MPLPILNVPAFPNVPNVPGVPPVLRSATGAINRLSGSITGAMGVGDALSSATAFAGQVSGLLAQSSGQVIAIAGTVRGVIDTANNISAALTSGTLGAQVVGAITGLVDRATGVITGTVDGVVDQLTGRVPDLGEGEPGTVTEAEPFQWGVFTQQGAPLIIGDSVAALDTLRDFRIGTYPIEEGGFQSYNKVEIPYTVRLTFTKGGTISEREAFLSSIDAAITSLTLCDVATPERTYTGVNVTHSEMRRTREQGANLLTVDVGLEQVRETASAAFSNTKAPSGASPTNTGAVQPITPTPARRVAIDAALTGAPSSTPGARP